MRNFIKAFPGKADSVLEKLDKGELRVNVDMTPIEELKTQIRKTGLILALSVIIATLMISITLTGESVRLPYPPVDLSVLSLVIIWIVGVFFIHRRL
jgi:hypothetical protein